MFDLANAEHQIEGW